MKKNKNKLNLPSSADILNFLRSEAKPLRVTAIADYFQLPQTAKKGLDMLLKALAAKKEIKRLPGNFWTLPSGDSILQGEFLANPGGGGRVRVTDPETQLQRDIRVSGYQANEVWHKDIVRVHVQSSGKCRILDIISRQNKIVLGIAVSRSRNFVNFKSTDARNNGLFSVSKKETGQLKLGPQTVVALEPIKRLASRSKKEEHWEAGIIKIIGQLDDEATQEAIVKNSQQVPAKFPDLALEQAAALPKVPDAADLDGREDFRATPFITIDGEDARDFDDAIHVEKTETGYILRVAIADVSHYVLPDGRSESLDAEARRRGNSWYFPRSVEPMLPKALSNGLCSLKPDEDRLAMLVEIHFNNAAAALRTRFAPIVIKSAARLTYTQVAKFFNGDQADIENCQVRQMLDSGRELYRLLFQMRRQRGTLDFILPDPAYTFDENGRLLSMKDAERNDAHLLIEEFMIAANEAVAEFLSEKGGNFLYRVHPEPEKEKLIQLFNTLSQTAPQVLPEHVLADREIMPADLQAILNNAKNTPQEYLVNRLCLRSMGQARYQPENIGHFGLASRMYCHFTSPIRRYADLLVHRALKLALQPQAGEQPDAEQLNSIANQLNGLERRAVECEREIAKRLACLALLGKEGQEFKGTVSGITDFGVFLEFDGMPAEGLIPIEALGDDWFEVDNASQSIVGSHTRKKWSLGQPIKATLTGVCLERQEITLAPLDPPPVARRGKQQRKQRGREKFYQPEKARRKRRK